MTFPANDNAVRTTLRALDLCCPKRKAGVGEPCREPLDYVSERTDALNHDYTGHHAARAATLRNVGDANAARAILRAILNPRKTKKDQA